MELVFTEQLRSKAIQFGACNGGVPKVGTKLSDISQSDLIWAESKRLLEGEEISPNLPLFAMAKRGSGSGSGSGSGDGDGSGDGYGDGINLIS